MEDKTYNKPQSEVYLGVTVQPRVTKKSYGIGDNVLLESIPGIKLNLFERNLEIINTLSPANCKVLFQVISRLNQRGELCKRMISQNRIEFEPVETEKAFYEAAGIDKMAWTRFKKAIEPWQLIKHCKVKISGGKGDNKCIRKSIIFDPTFFVSSYNKISVEQAVLYYDRIAPVLSTSKEKSVVLGAMRNIGKQIFSQFDQGKGLSEIIINTPVGEYSLKELPHISG